MNRPTTRRDFLKQAGAAAVAAQAGLASAPLHALTPSTASGGPVLLTIYLRGGADWLNMVAPWKDKTYEVVRPGIGLKKEDGIVELDSDFALHPGLAPFQPLWEQKRFAPILCTGSPHPTRSHFDAQDFMEYAAPGYRTIRDGWLNRYLKSTTKKDGSEFRALAMQELLPRSLRGTFPALAVPSSVDRRKGRKTLDKFEEFYGDGIMPGRDLVEGDGEGAMMEERPAAEEKLVHSGKMTIETLRRYQEIVGGVRTRDNGGYPAVGFGNQLRALAKVIKADAGLEVAGVDYNGWDHHVTQGGAEGRQRDMLEEFSMCIAHFCEDLGPFLDKTVIVIMTEFGRTVRENGNTGTDHGRGSGMFVLGGGVKGGKVHGDWLGLDDKVLADGRDLPVTTDFRDVMGTILEEHLGFKTPKGFFPDYQPKRLRLFG